VAKITKKEILFRMPQQIYDKLDALLMEKIIETRSRISMNQLILDIVTKHLNDSGITTKEVNQTRKTRAINGSKKVLENPHKVSKIVAVTRISELEPYQEDPEAKALMDRFETIANKTRIHRVKA